MPHYGSPYRCECGHRYFSTKDGDWMCCNCNEKTTPLIK